MAADIRDTLSTAIADLDIRAINDRVQEVEKTSAQHNTVLCNVTHKLDSHTLQLRDLQRHVEDLYNKGRRHNLRVRGLLESLEPEQLTTTITGLFNDLLDRPAYTNIEMEHIHHALRPKGRETDPPQRCGVLPGGLHMEGRHTLQGEKQDPTLTWGLRYTHLPRSLRYYFAAQERPETLCAKGIHYRWKFPFGLSATCQGRTALLRVPEDPQFFCNTILRAHEGPDMVLDRPVVNPRRAEQRITLATEKFFFLFSRMNQVLFSGYF